MNLEFKRHNDEIVNCKKCKRLLDYTGEIKNKYPTYYCKPVTGFGDVNAQVLILGLAPGRFGSNRTGRMFTGDSSGDFMYPVLHEVGFCNQSKSTDLNDGLKLSNAWITAVGRCAPPQNKPTPEELNNCFPYLASELKLLKKIKVIVALGKIAFDGYLKWLLEEKKAKYKKKDFVFSHGAQYSILETSQILLASYHPSRQNTQTGKLTKTMFKDIFLRANDLVMSN